MGRVAGWVGVLCGLVLGAGAVAGQEVEPMFRGGPRHLGVAVPPAGVELQEVAWRFETGATVRSSPVIHRGAVLVGSTDGFFYALDLTTGEPRWRYEAGAEVAGAGAVAGETVIFADRANVIHAVELGTGRLRWRKEGGADLPLDWGYEGWDYLLSSPTVVGDTVLVGTGDGRLYALDVASGREYWHHETGGRIRSAPAVHDGVVYVGAGDGIVYGVSLERGREVWRFVTDGVDWNAADFGFDRRQIYSSPAIADGVLYVGSRDAADYAIRLADRERIWQYRDGTPWVIASPAVGPDRIYTARSSGGAVLALDRSTGELAWSIRTGGLVFSSPLLAGETLLVGSGDRNVYALDARTGETRWRYRTDGAVMGTPALAGDRLVVGSDDGNVYAFQLGSGPPARLAVYWDSTLTGEAAWGGSPDHRRSVDFLTARGYELLDGAGLQDFLAEPQAGRSVVVAAMDAVPPEVLAEGGSSPLRRFLDRGGKVVWMGFPPDIWARNEEGERTGVDRARPTALLGVDHEGWDTDDHQMQVTEPGRSWGLQEGWVGFPGVDVTVADRAGSPRVTVLARDALGRAGAWAANYGGPPGTGFVQLRIGTDPAYLRELRRVAEYGILVPAAESRAGR